MQERIKVRYTNGDYEGAVRYLDPESLRLYFRPVSGNPASSVPLRTVSSTLWEHPTRGWRLSRCRDEQGGQPNPASTSPHPQAYKADDGKPNWFLLMSQEGCARALAGVVRVLSFAVRPVAQGGKGYAKHSWRQVPEAKERYEAALYRHLSKVSLGEELDDESGESHWYHIATNALFLAELHNEGKSQ